MKTLYKHVVGTPRSGAKRGMKRVSSDTKKGKNVRNMIIFTSCSGLSSLKSLAVSQQLQINNNNLT